VHIFKVANHNLFSLAVDKDRLRAGHDPYSFAGKEKFGITDCMGGGGAEIFNLADIAADIIGDAAAAVADEVVSVDDGDFDIRIKAPEAAGNLRPQGYGPDYYDFHDFSFGFQTCKLKLFLITANLQVKTTAL